MCSQAGHFVHRPAGMSFRGFNEKPFHFDFASLAIAIIFPSMVESSYRIFGDMAIKITTPGLNRDD
jgi:hypothetical protein